jgi:plastocyanin
MMKKIILFAVILLLSISFVQAGFYGDFFDRFDDPSLSVKLEQQLLFSSPFDSLTSSDIIAIEKVIVPIAKKVIIPVTESEPVTINQPAIIKITDSGFEPKEIKIQKGQTVVWKNERKKVSSLVYGLREIVEMKSDFIQPGDEFNWAFNQKGEFTYVDAVMIGRVGKIIVE